MSTHFFVLAAASVTFAAIVLYFSIRRGKTNAGWSGALTGGLKELFSMGFSEIKIMCKIRRDCPEQHG